MQDVPFRSRVDDEDDFAFELRKVIDLVSWSFSLRRDVSKRVFICIFDKRVKG